MNKYRNIKTMYNGVVFHSKKEASFAAQLDQLKKAEKPSERVEKYEMQVRYPLIVNDIKICTYVLDFLVTYSDGRKEHIDVKGFSTTNYKLKKKLMLGVHGITIIEK